ncbi:peptidase M15 [Mycolicibacterium wolinskyi]|uniref:Peptidase M15 n=1 Tax=Mycolicibacterium wolinskyi TaxID=59750 RepID=A0A132PEZ9_9MYCO|nr:M15 family metallopeptidase [Mycolicibacterium wolinskyi]KWX20916.1 peptidase M15 [Mycolicibacterium wolinskyi]
MTTDRPTARRRCAAALIAVACLPLVQCSATPPQPPPTAVSPPPSPTTTTTTTTATTTTRQPVPATVHPVTVAELGTTWRPGCPARPEVLRRVELDYLGFDGRTHRGALVVHKDLVPEVITIFEELLRQRYPIEKMRTVDHYPRADDELSMRDNNTSAFNCRGIPGSRSWSLHAYGRAIDVNPLLNPYIGSGGVEPANAGPYVDRSRIDPGLLHPGDPAVLAFTDRGWQWGGLWRSPIDYQHFEKR